MASIRHNEEVEINSKILYNITEKHTNTLLVMQTPKVPATSMLAYLPSDQREHAAIVEQALSLEDRKQFQKELQAINQRMKTEAEEHADKVQSLEALNKAMGKKLQKTKREEREERLQQQNQGEAESHLSTAA